MWFITISTIQTAFFLIIKHSHLVTGTCTIQINEDKYRCRWKWSVRFPKEIPPSESQYLLKHILCKIHWMAFFFFFFTFVENLLYYSTVNQFYQLSSIELSYRTKLWLFCFEVSEQLFTEKLQLTIEIIVCEGGSELFLYCWIFLFSDDLIQYTAMTWLREFIGQAGRTMIQYTPGIINAVLPNLQSISDREKKYPYITIHNSKLTHSVKACNKFDEDERMISL